MRTWLSKGTVDLDEGKRRRQTPLGTTPLERRNRLLGMVFPERIYWERHHRIQNIYSTTAVGDYWFIPKGHQQRAITSNYQRRPCPGHISLSKPLP